MENYLAIKRNKYSYMLRIWRNLKNITLSKRIQSQKMVYHMSPFLWTIQKRQIYETEIRFVIAWGWAGNRNWFKWAQGILGGNGNVLKLNCSDSWTTVNLLKNHWTVHPEQVNFMVCKLYLIQALKKIFFNLLGQVKLQNQYCDTGPSATDIKAMDKSSKIWWV